MKTKYNSIKPVLSIVTIISTLFFIVFAKMEERRLGYLVLKLMHEQKNVLAEKREKSILLAKTIRPQNVEKVAQDKFTLKRLQSRQIIHMTGSNYRSQD